MTDTERSIHAKQPVRSRPRMTPGYGIRRDPKGMLEWAFASERLAAARNYWVATTRPDRRPHVAPVWGIWTDEVFYFSTDPASRKGRNLSASPHAAVHLESGDEVVVLEGRVEEVDEKGIRARFADAYEAKYKFRPDVNDPAAKVYRLKAETALAWTEKDFPGTATRWSFDDSRIRAAAHPRPSQRRRTP